LSYFYRGREDKKVNLVLQDQLDQEDFLDHEVTKETLDLWDSQESLVTQEEMVGSIIFSK